MSDPSFKAEEAPPPQPPRPTQGQPRTQLEQDELYARQLAAHYQESSRSGHPQQQQQQQQRRPGEAEDDREYSFFDGEQCTFRPTRGSCS